MIYHLAWESEWRDLVQDGLYSAASLDSEGFIHCTREPEKLVEVANLFFQEVRSEPLFCLTIDPDQLSSEVRYEDPGVGHLFPHVYGPIETNAVVGMREMVRTDSGWELPKDH